MFLMPLYLFVVVLSCETVPRICFILVLIDDASNTVLCYSTSRQFMSQISQMLQALTFSLSHSYDLFPLATVLFYSHTVSLIFSPTLLTFLASWLLLDSLSLSLSPTHRGQVGSEYEWDISWRSGKIFAGGKAQHCPWRLLEAHRLFTSLEGKCPLKKTILCVMWPVKQEIEWFVYC